MANCSTCRPRGCSPPTSTRSNSAWNSRSAITGLWAELTRDELFSDDERYRIHDRLRRINELGYDVEGLELVQDTQYPGLTRMVLKTSVLEPGLYRRLLQQLTGLDVQENQARVPAQRHAQLRCVAAGRGGPSAARGPDRAPVDGAVVRADRGERARGHARQAEPAEIFHDVIDHWHHLSELKGSDAGLFDAARSYLDTVLRFEPEERRVSPSDADDRLDDLEPDALIEFDTTTE